MNIGTKNALKLETIVFCKDDGFRRFLLKKNPKAKLPSELSSRKQVRLYLLYQDFFHLISGFHEVKTT